MLGSPLDVLEKLGGKPKLKYKERLKRILMMTRKNNVVIRELNNNIDHKNVVIIWVSLCLQIKYDIFL